LATPTVSVAMPTTRSCPRSAAAVKTYLVGKGVEANRVYTEGKGEKQPVTTGKCNNLGKDSGKNKKLVECLQPDRRVEIEVIGTK
jgi:OOP family OmpA-OmpF porin